MAEEEGRVEEMAKERDVLMKQVCEGDKLLLVCRAELKRLQSLSSNHHDNHLDNHHDNHREDHPDNHPDNHHDNHLEDHTDNQHNNLCRQSPASNLYPPVNTHPPNNGEEVGRLNEEVGRLNQEVEKLTGEVGRLNGEAGRLNGEIGRLNGKVERLKGDLEESEKMCMLYEEEFLRLAGLEEDLEKLKVGEMGGG